MKRHQLGDGVFCQGAFLCIKVASDHMVFFDIYTFGFLSHADGHGVGTPWVEPTPGRRVHRAWDIPGHYNFLLLKPRIRFGYGGE